MILRHYIATTSVDDLAQYCSIYIAEALGILHRSVDLVAWEWRMSVYRFYGDFNLWTHFLEENEMEIILSYQIQMCQCQICWNHNVIFR